MRGFDSVWPSCLYTKEVKSELAKDLHHSFVSLDYPDAGNGIGSIVPYTNFHEVAASEGRDVAADPLAREKAWPALLRFLATAS